MWPRWRLHRPNRRRCTLSIASGARAPGGRGGQQIETDHFGDEPSLPMRPHRRRKRHSQHYSNLIHEAVMPHSNRFKLSLAGTAAVALASLPLAISPASAAKVTEGTTSSIGVMETAGNASQFNWSVNNGQSVAQSTTTEQGGRGRDGRGNASRQTGSWLDRLFEFLGIQTTSSDSTDRPTESISISGH